MVGSSRNLQVLAEKFETVITRGVTNTRMRDFYDVYILTTTQKFDGGTFNAALDKTIEKRGTAEQMSDVAETIVMVAQSPVMIGLWEKYRKKYSYAAEVTWEMAIDALRGLAENAPKRASP